MELRSSAMLKKMVISKSFLSVMDTTVSVTIGRKELNVKHALEIYHNNN